MQHGFLLFIDEAGDEGIDRVRPLDENGASEYFILSGILIRTGRNPEVGRLVEQIKDKVGLKPADELHFRKLSPEHQLLTLKDIAEAKIGIISIASNKRNMRGYKNERVEAKNYEIVRNRKRPKSNNWFYNNLFRYMIERASRECSAASKNIYGKYLPIKIIFSHRSGFSYSQTKAYLHKLSVERHDRSYYNNKLSIDWSVVKPSEIFNLRAKQEPGLQLADCVASAIFKAIDEDWFGKINPEYMDIISHLFLKKNGSPQDYGFKLLPDGFSGPLSASQKRSLLAGGYVF